MQQMISKALIEGDQSGLRRKLEKKIDENVPEEYRETARGILDLLGRSLEKEKKDFDCSNGILLTENDYSICFVGRIKLKQLRSQDYTLPDQEWPSHRQ